jgi:hypothetical protein
MFTEEEINYIDTFFETLYGVPPTEEDTSEFFDILGDK